jgi:hypothetical protein
MQVDADMRKIGTISTMTWSDAPVLKGGGQSRVPGGAAEGSQVWR